MKRFTLEQIEEMHVSKGELIKLADIPEPFDYALPQEWLNTFVEATGLDYHLVRSTTVCCYGEGVVGHIVSACKEVQDALDNLDKCA